MDKIQWFNCKVKRAVQTVDEDRNPRAVFISNKFLPQCNSALYMILKHGNKLFGACSHDMDNVLDCMNFV